MVYLKNCLFYSYYYIFIFAYFELLTKLNTNKNYFIVNFKTRLFLYFFNVQIMCRMFYYSYLIFSYDINIKISRLHF
jgi:hypothetical protein